MNLKIRKATEEDFEIVQNFTQKLNKDQHDNFDKSINTEFAHSPGGMRYLQRVLEGGGVIFIAEDDRPIGFIVAAVEPVGDFRIIDNYCEIDFMWVDDSYRNKGIGKNMMERVEGWCKEKNIKRMRITVDFLNKGAMKLYKEQSFKEYDLILEKELW